MKGLRSVGAVVGGYAIIVLLTTIGFTWWLGNPDFYRADGLTRLLGGAVAIVAGLIGGFAAGRIAGRRPVFHAALVLIPLLADSIYVLFVWRLRQAHPSPLWFEATGSVTLMLATIAGGWLAARRMRSAPAGSGAAA